MRIPARVSSPSLRWVDTNQRRGEDTPEKKRNDQNHAFEHQNDKIQTFPGKGSLAYATVAVEEGECAESQKPGLVHSLSEST